MTALATPQLELAQLSTSQPDFEEQLARLRHWSADTDERIEARVAEIIADVRSRGDVALVALTAQLDGVEVAAAAELEIPAAALKQAFESLPTNSRQALQVAAQRVRAYHQRQLDACGRSWHFRDREGNVLGQKLTPLNRVGIYVPGGKASYPSSVLMNAIPAQVAGVHEIVMVVPTPQGERNPLVLAAAHLAGVHRVFTIGGAQAVAALAYGTATVPAVDKITGPGNAYVASAKRRVFGQVGIDMIAGPSEILVIADGSTPPDWVAMDLFSQAEHDELAQSILLCPDADYIAQVVLAMDKLLPQMPRQAAIRASLQGRGALIHTRSMEEACALSDRLAPEHLEICARDARHWESLLKHAGAIFIGPLSSESLGDYCAGPNHVLPTAGTARFSSPLGVYDFQKRSSLIEISAEGAEQLGPVAAVLAYGEGLQAHAKAAEMRLSVALAGAPLATASAPSTLQGAFEVREVSADNVDALMALDVAAGQRALVAPVTRSLAQAAYEPAGRPLGLFVGDTAVGFLMLFDAAKARQLPTQQLYIWRLMIDARYQRLGLGRQTMQWVVAEAKRQGLLAVGLSHRMDEGNAGPFYAKLGFVYTGEIDDGEHVMALRLQA